MSDKTITVNNYFTVIVSFWYECTAKNRWLMRFKQISQLLIELKFAETVSKIYNLIKQTKLFQV